MSGKKNVHWTVSGAGWIGAVISALWVALFQLGKKMGLTEEDVETRIHRLATSEGVPIIEQIAALILGQAPTDWWSKFFITMIQAGQFVSGVNPNITGANFPFRDGDDEPQQVEVVSIKQRIRDLGVSLLTTQQVIDYLDALGYRPATIVELMWWWVKNPSKLSDCFVVALGSVWNDSVPCIRGYGAYRILRLDMVEDGWRIDFEFAAVRK